MTSHRYRLRFLLQEFDLPRGATVVGRSLDCNLTVEDPLVSRQHARIVIDDDGARIEDMSSRNGVKVNGVAIKVPTTLKDGDRLRIGTQDFVFCRVDAAGGSQKTTGQLRLCANCRLPYPREMIACPNCEATEQTDDETLSGNGAQGQSAWGVQLLVEALERALLLGRTHDAERIVKRATAQLEELVASKFAVDARALASLASLTVQTSIELGDPTWGLWVFDVYRRVNRIPPVEVVDRLRELAARHKIAVRGSLGALLDHLASTSRSASQNDVDALARLEQMRQFLDENVPGSEESTGEWPQPS